MRRGAALVATAIAVVLAVGLVAPAFGGPSLLQRVKKLERRTNATAAVVVHANHRRVRVFNSSVSPSYQGNGVWAGTATCPDGEVTGGGVSSTGARTTTDNIIQSYPTAIGWYAEVHSNLPGPTLLIYAVCTSIR